MNSNKEKAKHSRQERLKKLAEEEASKETTPEEHEDPAIENDEDIDSDSPTEILKPVEAASDETPEGDKQPESESGDETAALEPTEALQDNATVRLDIPAIEDDPDALAGFDIDAAGYPFSDHIAEDGAFVPPDFAEIPAKRKRRALRALGITIGVVIGIVLIVYIVGAVSFMSRFLPNTFIGDYDISMKTDEEVKELLEEQIAAYQLDVVGNGFTYQTTSKDIGLSIDSDGIVRAMHNDLDAWEWPLLIMEPEHNESRHMVITYKKDDCEADVAAKVKKFNKDAKAPVDATIVFNEESGAFEVKPEEEGTQFSPKKVKATVTEAIAKLQPRVTLSDEQLKKPKVYSTDKKLKESAELATGMVSAHVTLNLNGQNVAEIDSEELSRFVSISDDLDVKFKEGELDDWVRDLANGYDTIGTARNYTRDDGKQITVKGGSYGWEVDTAATKEAVLEAIKDGKQTELDIPCISTAAVYTGPGERDWGNRYIDVDISEQHVCFYGDNGKIIWQADCISGAPDGKRDTWEGVWYINNKESPSTLIGYTESGKKEYETDVTYWMPFEGNGIGFHDASWQPGFGGTMYADGYGSHGCVNLSTKDAKRLYSLVEIGDVVVVHS